MVFPNKNGQLYTIQIELPIYLYIQFAAPSFCLRDSAFALHLRHTIECDSPESPPPFSPTCVHRYLRLLILRWAMGHFPEGFHRFIWLYVQYTHFFGFVNGYLTAKFVTVFSTFVFPPEKKYGMMEHHIKKENLYASHQKRLHQNYGWP